MEAREIEQCIDRFGDDVYRFCMSLCQERSDAEDLYQQTFLKALETNLDLDWEQNPKALFFSLAHKLWKSTMRKTARRLALAPCGSIDDEASLRSSENVEEDYLHRELLLEVSRCLEDLPERFRLPLILYYVFDFSVEETAKALEKPAGTVKSRLSKGRALMKKRLKEAGYHDRFS